MGYICLKIQTRVNTRTSVQGGNCIDVMTVEKLSVSTHASWNIKGSTLETGPTNVKNEGKLSSGGLCLFDTRWFTLERNHTSIMNVVRLLASGQLLTNIRDSTQEKSNTTVMNVAKPFARKQDSFTISRATEETLYQCLQYNKSFNHCSTLTQNQGVHIGTKPYECNECGRFLFVTHLWLPIRKCTTRRNPSLKVVLLSIRETIPERSLCDICGKAFVQKSNLIYHEQIHTPERPYKCAEYGKAFTQRSVLTRPQGVHTGEKPYKCDECGKTFRQRSDLSKHQRIHSRSGPCKCNKCGELFRQNSTLNHHQTTHNRELFLCDDYREAIFQSAGR